MANKDTLERLKQSLMIEQAPNNVGLESLKQRLMSEPDQEIPENSDNQGLKDLRTLILKDNPELAPKSRAQKVSEYVSGAIEGFGDTIMPFRPTQVIPAIGNAIVDKFNQQFGSATAKPFSQTFSEAYKESRFLTEEAKRKSPSGYETGRIIGTAGAFLTPIPGKRESLIVKLGIEAGRGAAVSGWTSEHPIGSPEWLIDGGFGALFGAAGEAGSIALKAGSKWIGKAATDSTERITAIAARELSAKQRVSQVAAMQAKFRGQTRIAQRIPFIGELAKKMDDKVAGYVAGKGGKAGEFLADAYLKTGGSLTLGGTLLAGGILNLDTSLITDAYTGLASAAALGAVISVVNAAPDKIVGFVSGSKYAAPLRVAAKAGPDAFKATMLMLSQDERFQEFIIDGAAGEGTYKRLTGQVDVKSLQDLKTRLLSNDNVDHTDRQ